MGVERSETGLRIGRAHGRRLLRGTVTQLPVADATIDLVTSFDVLYCLDERAERAAAREMWRVLKPGGFALVNAAALDILHGSHSALTMEQRRYTPRRLASLLTEAGFSIARMTFTNAVTFPLTLAARLKDRLTGRAEVASDANLRLPPAPVNALLSGAVAVDGALLRFVNLPIGSSLMCLARKDRTPFSDTTGCEADPVVEAAQTITAKIDGHVPKAERAQRGVDGLRHLRLEGTRDLVPAELDARDLAVVADAQDPEAERPQRVLGGFDRAELSRRSLPRSTESATRGRPKPARPRSASPPRATARGCPPSTAPRRRAD